MTSRGPGDDQSGRAVIGVGCSRSVRVAARHTPRPFVAVHRHHGRALVASSFVRLADFDYELPEERIAQTPIEPRDSARLLVDRGDAEPLHRRVRDLGELLAPGDLLVVNDSKVIPARLRLQRHSGGAAEVLLLEPLRQARMRRWRAGETWEALVRPGKKLKVRRARCSSRRDGTAPIVVEVGVAREPRRATRSRSRCSATATRSDDPGRGTATCRCRRTSPRRSSAPSRYQTVYADEPGSAAAPTAGLHFTPELLRSLESSRRARSRASSWSSDSTRSSR